MISQGAPPADHSTRQPLQKFYSSLKENIDKALESWPWKRFADSLHDLQVQIINVSLDQRIVLLIIAPNSDRIFVKVHRFYFCAPHSALLATVQLSTRLCSSCGTCEMDGCIYRTPSDGPYDSEWHSTNTDKRQIKSMTATIGSNNNKQLRQNLCIVPSSAASQL